MVKFFVARPIEPDVLCLDLVKMASIERRKRRSNEASEIEIMSALADISADPLFICKFGL